MMPRFICIWALLLGVVPSLAGARVTMEAHLGLQGTVRLEKWNVVTVRLRNTGSPLQATLGVRVWRGSELRGDLHVTSYTRPVQLPPRARKRFSFVVPITSIARPVEVFLRTDETVLLQQSLDLRASLTTEQVLLGLTRDLSLDFLATLFQTHTRVAYLAPQDLPQSWQGYDSVSALVVKGVSLQTLSAAQVTALRQWLARGGTLIVAGDSQYGLLQEPHVQALLPVRVLGVQQRDGLPALAAHYGAPLPAAPLMAIRARLHKGDILVGTAAAPILVQRAFGKGRVVFLAVDYATQPLAGWPGNAALWKEMLQPVEEIDFSRVFAELGLLDESQPVVKLLGRPILAYPSHLALTGFLLAYCTCLGGLFWWMRRQRSQNWRAWAVLGLFVLGFTAAAYGALADRGLRQTALLFDLTTMEVLPDTEQAHTQGFLGIFSASGGQFALTLQQPASIMRHTFTRGAGQAGQALEVTTVGTPMIRGIKLASWALRLFSIESMMPAPLQVLAQQHPAGLTIHVDNRSAFPLQGAMVAYRGTLFPLETIASGETLLEDLFTAPRVPEHASERAWQALFTLRPPVDDARLAYMQEALLQHHFGEKRLIEVSTAPLLIGWFMAPMTLQATPGMPTVWGITLVVSQMTLTRPSAG